MLVQALKEHKKTVAMTGDGVNDVLALKDADCSVAMASGSEAASNVAQLVLLDSDFSRMPSVVAEGRRVVNNIERTAALYIVKNIFSMLLAIFLRDSDAGLSTGTITGIADQYVYDWYSVVCSGTGAE